MSMPLNENLSGGSRVSFAPAVLPGPLLPTKLLKRAPLPGGGSSTSRNAPLEELRVRLLDVEEHRDDGPNEEHRDAFEGVQEDREEEDTEDETWTQEEEEERAQQVQHAEEVMLRLRQLTGFSQGLADWRRKVANTLPSTISTLEQQGREYNLANAAIPMVISQAEAGVDLTSSIDLQEENLNRLQLKSNEDYTYLQRLVRKRHLAVQEDDIEEGGRATRLKNLNEDIPVKAWLVAYARQKMYQRYLQLEGEVERLSGSKVGGRR